MAIETQVDVAAETPGSSLIVAFVQYGPNCVWPNIIALFDLNFLPFGNFFKGE